MTEYHVNTPPPCFRGKSISIRPMTGVGSMFWNSQLYALTSQRPEFTALLRRLVQASHWSFKVHLPWDFRKKPMIRECSRSSERIFELLHVVELIPTMWPSKYWSNSTDSPTISARPLNLPLRLRRCTTGLSSIVSPPAIRLILRLCSTSSNLASDERYSQTARQGGSSKPPWRSFSWRLDVC